MKFGQTLGKAIGGLVIIAGPFSMAVSQSVQAAEVVRSLSLEERVERLETQQQNRNKAMVELQYKISEMQQEIRNLLGTQEENNYRLTQLTERQREIYKDIDRRLSEAQKSLKTMSGSNSGSRFRANPKTVKSANSTSSVAAVNSGRSEAKAYEQIFPLVRGKKYAQAITAYQQFLANYPATKYAVNAHYWLGQVHFVQGQLEPATHQFQLVSDKYPTSSKAPDALLKLGIIYAQQNKMQQAKDAFTKLSREFPGSSSARLAERRLKELNSPLKAANLDVNSDISVWRSTSTTNKIDTARTIVNKLAKIGKLKSHSESVEQITANLVVCVNTASEGGANNNESIGTLLMACAMKMDYM